MIEIPDGIRTFVLAGIGLLFVAVPLRVAWGMTRESRDRRRRLRELAGRLGGRFGSVRIEGGWLGPRRILLECEGRPAAVAQPSPGEIAVRVEPGAAPRAHAVIRTRGRFGRPFAWMAESFRFLRRVRTLDPLIDDSMDVYASASFGALIRELARDGVSPAGKPEGLVESLTVLRRLPGTAGFELRMSPSGGFRLRFRLRDEGLLYRPEDVESALHHAFRLYDLLALA